MRTLVIGDVHGCLDELRDLLAAAGFEQGSDEIVLVGDLMDRGPDPSGCVRLARELGAKAVKSNHDEKFPRFRKHEERRLATGKKNPMVLAPNELERADREAEYTRLTDEDLAWIASLPEMLWITPTMVVVHAGLEPAFPADKQHDAVIRVRYVDDGTRGKPGEMVGSDSYEQPENTVPWNTVWKGPESVIYGHAVHSRTEPQVDRFEGGACYGIDTGCVYGGRLTAAIVVPGREVEFVQVQARREYMPFRKPEDASHA